MKDSEQKAAAKAFAEYWKGKGYEKGNSQPFWLSLLRQVFGIQEPEKYITFEEQVHLEHTSFIDAYIPETCVMIEQKGLGKDLNKPIKQSDGTMLKPIQQAQRYAATLPRSQYPRWIITCNFAEFCIYDMERPQADPEIVLLKNLDKEYYRLEFIANVKSKSLKKEMEISLQAGELVGKMYSAFAEQYKNLDTDEHEQKSLNMLCVRLVFCLYAEDAGIFGKHNMFHDYLASFMPENARHALIDLFKALDTKDEDRDPYMEEKLAAFPYVNGGLFADEHIVIPNITPEIIQLILEDCSENFDWSGISPTIFGAVFESTLNPETRRAGGMHYTSIENIHKVIDPLFLDDLKKEFEEIQNTRIVKQKNFKLKNFQQKLGSLKFFDPACGSGNFLTETYISLRKLENKVLKEELGVEMVMGGLMNPIQVSIGQFYGIEINDFAVSVAKTALWIAESQMMQETIGIVHMDLDFLPLKSYNNIMEGNALRLDWNEAAPRKDISYIMGNPPFVGFTYMNSNQKEDMEKIFPGIKNLDYVACWYKCAQDYIQGTHIECAFVSTNSITEGETVARLWERISVHINFAHRSFVWDSESNAKAHVHCVIIGFSLFDRSQKFLYQGNQKISVSNINAYLCDAPNILVKSRM